MTITYELILDPQKAGVTACDVPGLIEKSGKTTRPFVRKLIDSLQAAGYTLEDVAFGALPTEHAYVSRYTGPMDSRREREVTIEVNEPKPALQDQLVKLLERLPGVMTVRKDSRTLRPAATP
jgi:hypothetical protein